MGEIVKVSREVLAIQDYQPKDLGDPTKADAFVRLYAEKKQASEKAALEFEAMKDEAERLTAEYKAQGKPVTVYGIATEKKVCREFAKKEYSEITEQSLLAGLCEYYHEDINDRSGKAWEAFKSVTRPVAMPRVIDEEKLEQAMLGQNLKVPVKVLENPEVTKTVPATFKTMLREFNASEKKQAAAGKLEASLVVKG